MRGTVRNWHDDAGYGFFRGDGGDDTFAHVSQLPKGVGCLAVGQLVEYDIGISPRTGRDMAVRIPLVAETVG